MPDLLEGLDHREVMVGSQGQPPDGEVARRGRDKEGQALVVKVTEESVPLSLLSMRLLTVSRMRLPKTEP